MCKLKCFLHLFLILINVFAYGFMDMVCRPRGLCTLIKACDVVSFWFCPKRTKHSCFPPFLLSLTTQGYCIGTLVACVEADADPRFVLRPFLSSTTVYIHHSCPLRPHLSCLGSSLFGCPVSKLIVERGFLC